MSSWVTHQARYDRMLQPFTDALLDAVRLTGSERIVDIGCGTGASALAFANHLGGQGSIVGIDVNPAVVAAAEIRLTGTPNAAVLVGDAATYPFAAEFDILISQFGTMLFDAPLPAHQNLAKALVPHGRLAVLTWQGMERNLWHVLPLEAVQAEVDLGDGGTASSPGPFAFANPHHLEQLLIEAGFSEITIQPVLADVWVAQDPHDAVRFFDDDAGDQLRRTVGPERMERILANLLRLVEPHTAPDGIRLPAAAWLATATAA
jgi:SAM-dependent methyltransferase